MSDLIFYNGRIITMEEKLGEVEAVAVEGGRIKALGPAADILNLQEDHTTLVDLRSRALLPGFNDSHMHLVGYALTSEKVDLRRCRGVDEIVDAIRAYVSNNKVGKGQWVLGWGWDQALFRDKRIPNRQDLDRAAPDHPVAIMRTCCHVMVANSAALKAAGIDRKAVSVEGGKIEVDDRGIPTGLLEEKAMSILTNLQPPLDKAKLKKLIKSAAGDFLAAGLTSVQTDDLSSVGGECTSMLIDTYYELEAAGELPLRVNLQALLPEPSLLGNFLARGYRTGQGGQYFKIGPLKLLTDGSIGGKTALVSAPYEGSSETCGVSVLARGEVEELVNMAAGQGMQCAVHAIGDAAVKMVLEIYQDAARRYPHSDPRFRVIHASMAGPKILDRFENQGVIADIQPSFISSDYILVDRHLGPKRAVWTYRWKDFMDRGIRLAGGSDCPVETYEPLEGIHAAVTRQDRYGNPPGGWNPDQCLSLQEALYIYTMGSAYCTYEENEKGSIAEGKLADLVVLSEDITTVEPSAIADLKADLTVVNGRIVYSRGEQKN